MLPNPATDSRNKAGNFLRMLRQLRLYEEVVLYANIPEIDAQESEEAAAFLLTEYEREGREYPAGAPPFNRDAALWAAKMIYRAAQLMLYREQKAAVLGELFPPFAGERDLSAILSADLTLRFIPSILEKLLEIDPEDHLLPILKKFAAEWDYSSIGSRVESALPDFQRAGSNSFLMKLYIDRIITLREQKLAEIPAVNAEIRGALGLYTNELWSNFDLIKITT